MSRTEILLALAVCLLLAANTSSGQGFYVTVNGGYGFGAGTQTIGTNSTFTDPTGSVEGVYGSLGEGIKFGTSAGYMFNANFGAELGLSYWLGKPFETTYRDPLTMQTSKSSGSGIVAVPSVVIAANMKPVNPYARFGLVLGILNLKTEQSLIVTSNRMDVEMEDRGGMVLGFAGALGIVVPAGAVDFFAEAVLHALSYSPSKYEITKYNVNGVDQLPSLQPTEFDYKESYSYSEQYVTLAVRRPFSSIGLAAGVRISL